MIVVALVIRASHRKGWSDTHRFALATGGLLAYCWYGFLNVASLYGVASLPAQAVWAVLAVVLLVFIARRDRTQIQFLSHEQSYDVRI